MLSRKTLTENKNIIWTDNSTENIEKMVFENMKTF